MHVVLLSIFPNRIANLLLLCSRNRVLTCIHVSHFCLLEAFRECCPSLRLYIVSFPNVETPDTARRELQNLEQM